MSSVHVREYQDKCAESVSRLRQQSVSQKLFYVGYSLLRRTVQYTGASVLYPVIDIASEIVDEDIGRSVTEFDLILAYNGIYFYRV